jgi:hypothetical protein
MVQEDVGTPQYDEEEYYTCGEAQYDAIALWDVEDEIRSQRYDYPDYKRYYCKCSEL